MICNFCVLFKSFDVDSDPEMDSESPEKSDTDTDPEIIFSDPTHWIQVNKFTYNKVSGHPHLQFPTLAAVTSTKLLYAPCINILSFQSLKLYKINFLSIILFKGTVKLVRLVFFDQVIEIARRKSESV